jgi:hypothetical protein
MWLLLISLACDGRAGDGVVAAADGGASDGGAADSGAADGGTTTGDSGSAGDGGGGTGTDGPCSSFAPAVEMGAVADADLDELSGLVVSRQNPGVLWTHEDSGGAAVLYALDQSGLTVATLQIEGATNTDWEDLALGPCDAGTCLYIGDTGDLGTDRSDFEVLVVPEPLLDGTLDASAEAEHLPFRYPGDPEDSEALVVTPDGVPLVITKRSDATAGVYALAPGATVLTWQADIPTGAEGEDLTARATAADLWPDGSALLLRTYLHLYQVDLSDPQAPGTPQELDFALELQGEAVAWDPSGGFWQVGEGGGATLWFTGCE